MAWKASWAHRTCENEKKKDYDKIKKSVQTSSACGTICMFTNRTEKAYVHVLGQKRYII